MYYLLSKFYIFHYYFNFFFIKKEYDAELAEKVKEIKYAEHNKEWVETMN